MPVAFPPCPKIMLSVGDTRELKKEKKKQTANFLETIIYYSSSYLPLANCSLPFSKGIC
jgi:hypothetical protein